MVFFWTSSSSSVSAPHEFANHRAGSQLKIQEHNPESSWMVPSSKFYPSNSFKFCLLFNWFEFCPLFFIPLFARRGCVLENTIDIVMYNEIPWCLFTKIVIIKLISILSAFFVPAFLFGSLLNKIGALFISMLFSVSDMINGMLICL